MNAKLKRLNPGAKNRLGLIVFTLFSLMLLLMGGVFGLAIGSAQAPRVAGPEAASPAAVEPAERPAAAGGQGRAGGGWLGEYFANPNLAGAPLLTRSDEVIDFAWRETAPAAGLAPERLSVRWTRSAYFDGTTHRFHVAVDGGARLWVDDQLILDSWWDGDFRERTMDVVPVRGVHDLRVEFYNAADGALIEVGWDKVAWVNYPEWKGEYWSNASVEGEPSLVRNDVGINFNWGLGAPVSGLPADGFSARWIRIAQFEQATYTFHVVVDDGARLWVDDRLVLDSWRDGASREEIADIALEEGLHHLRVEFYDRTGEALIQVWWERMPSQ